MAIVKKTAATKTVASSTKKVVAKAAQPAAIVKKALKTVPAAPVKKGALGRPATAGAKKTGAAKPARAKKKVILFAAPADFKPHFLLVEVHVEKDGLIGGNVQATRYVGRFDPAADEKKKFNLADYDQDTLRAVTARLAGMTYKATSERFYEADPASREGVRGSHRLPKATVFHVLFRVGKRTADGSLMTRVVKAFQRVTKKSVKTGKTVSKSVELLKTDPVNRLIRRVGRIMPAAFKNVMMPPKRTRGSRAEADAEE